jgi:hypothetical protein
MTFHDDFAQIVGEGLPYRVFQDGDLWTIRCYELAAPDQPDRAEDEVAPVAVGHPTGATLRMIQYEIDGDDFRILSLSTESGGGHILRIAAKAADLFKAEGFKQIKGKDFTSTPAGEAFKAEVEGIGGTERDGFSVLSIDDFQKLKAVKADKDKTKGDPGKIAEP